MSEVRASYSVNLSTYQGCIFFFFQKYELLVGWWKKLWFIKKKCEYSKRWKKRGKRGSFYCTAGKKISFWKRGGGKNFNYLDDLHPCHLHKSAPTLNDKAVQVGLVMIHWLSFLLSLWRTEGNRKKQNEKKTYLKRKTVLNILCWVPCREFAMVSRTYNIYNIHIWKIISKCPLKLGGGVKILADASVKKTIFFLRAVLL